MFRTLCCFLPFAACITTSSTMKAAPKGRVLHISLARILQILSLKGIINSVIDLPSTFGRYQGKTAIAYIILGVSWTTLTKILKKAKVPWHILKSLKRTNDLEFCVQKISFQTEEKDILWSIDYQEDEAQFWETVDEGNVSGRLKNVTRRECKILKRKRKQ